MYSNVKILTFLYTGVQVKMPVQILTAVLCFIGCAVFMWVPYLLDGKCPYYVVL